MTWRCLVGGGGVFSGHPAWWGPEFLAPPPLPPSHRRCLQRPPSAPPSVSASSSRRCSRTAQGENTKRIIIILPSLGQAYKLDLFPAIRVFGFAETLSFILEF